MLCTDLMTRAIDAFPTASNVSLFFTPSYVSYEIQTLPTLVISLIKSRSVNAGTCRHG